jgi:hypothetical protein
MEFEFETEEEYRQAIAHAYDQADEYQEESDYLQSEADEWSDRAYLLESELDDFLDYQDQLNNPHPPGPGQLVIEDISRTEEA